jgi:hypothetical protein
MKGADFRRAFSAAIAGQHKAARNRRSRPPAGQFAGQIAGYRKQAPTRESEQNMNNMPSAGYDGPATVITQDGTVLGVEANLHPAHDGAGLAGSLHLAAAFESQFNDGDSLTLNTPHEAADFVVTGTVLLGGGQHAGGVFIQFQSDEPRQG